MPSLGEGPVTKTLHLPGFLEASIVRMCGVFVVRRGENGKKGKGSWGGFGNCLLEELIREARGFDGAHPVVLSLTSLVSDVLSLMAPFYFHVLSSSPPLHLERRHVILGFLSLAYFT